MYGNYDGLDRPPMFDLYIGVNFWTTVNMSQLALDMWRQAEAIVVVPDDYVHVCLVNSGAGTPCASSTSTSTPSCGTRRHTSTTVPPMIELPLTHATPSTYPSKPQPTQLCRQFSMPSRSSQSCPSLMLAQTPRTYGTVLDMNLVSAMQLWSIFLCMIHIIKISNDEI